MHQSDTQDDRYGRIEGLIDLAPIQTARVTIAGLGTVGNSVAMDLGRHGLATQSPGRIRLIDGDNVELRNLIGTAYRQDHVGTPKAEATASMLREINDAANVSYRNRMIDTSNLDEVVQLAGQSDLLCLFADAFDLMSTLADQCHGTCTVVMAAIGDQADVAEVGFSVPGQTPPLSHTMGRRKRRAISKPKALGCDTGFITSFISSLCIRLLIDQALGKQLLPCYADAPLYVIGLRRVWLFEQFPDDVVRSVICVAQSKGEST
mgnify:FL=1